MAKELRYGSKTIFEEIRRMIPEQKFVLSLYPDAKCIQSVRVSKQWFVRTSDGTNLSMCWRNMRKSTTKEMAWQAAADNLNYEILRTLAS